MGGGDLNLKKSWHPSTLRNIERVWKAEQKHEVEKQKIEQLQKELAEERAREEIQAFGEDRGVLKKKDERLEWMYQGPAAMVNRDEYLLGRKIDKTLETLKQMEEGVEPSQEDDADVGSTVFSSQNLSGTATVDLANKIREDPLFSIMKKEKEERKHLLTNPVKMKQLQQMLKESLGSKKKKSKKSKKKKHHESDSDEEKQEKRRKKHKKSDSSESEDEHRPSKESWKDHNSKNKISDKERFSSDRRSSKYENDAFNSYERRNKNSHFPSDERDKSHRSTHKNSRSLDPRESNYESYHKDRSNRNHYSKPYDSKAYNQREENSSKADKKRKLDSADKERLLQEMQQNAKWREDQRKRNTQRYKEEDEKEEKTHKIDTSDFLKPMLSKAVGKGSLENRVKQKIFTLQRSSADMDKHFARRD